MKIYRMTKKEGRKMKKIQSILALIMAFAMLFAFTIGNVYYIWGCMMIFSAARYFIIESKDVRYKILK